MPPFQLLVERDSGVPFLCIQYSTALLPTAAGHTLCNICWYMMEKHKFQANTAEGSY